VLQEDPSNRPSDSDTEQQMIELEQYAGQKTVQVHEMGQGVCCPFWKKNSLELLDRQCGSVAGLIDHALTGITSFEQVP
jgi:hypothetical protein